MAGNNVMVEVVATLKPFFLSLAGKSVFIIGRKKIEYKYGGWQKARSHPVLIHYTVPPINHSTPIVL